MSIGPDGLGVGVGVGVTAVVVEAAVVVVLPEVVSGSVKLPLVGSVVFPAPVTLGPAVAVAEVAFSGPV